ncbi:MAG: bifunctional folylpolyglutamate synthase/dihydrofolate synthase [Bacteroidales bacterium]|nr:bifunctional folylpolyglutamate synthase/dihydrofolate synthase [Bacteroidales bacterium]
MTEQQYNEQIEYIFNRFPSFQRVGAGAYKPGIEGMEALAEATGNQHKKFSSIHIAGTNGKGSTSHMLAAALCRMQKSLLSKSSSHTNAASENLKVGLYTSPHLVDFRERIKISSPDGFKMISKEYVYNFINLYKEVFERERASFFEITTAMAFAWFAHNGVDIAVIECGLGGRLDSTNIILPQLSVITNIGLDHCDFLGNTLESVASEKAGIIKRDVPVVIGEESGVGGLFRQRAVECGAPILFAEEYISKYLIPDGLDVDKLDLKGLCQDKNIKTVVAALEILIGNGLEGQYAGGEYTLGAVVEGIHNAASITGLRGRWERLCSKPFVVCDTGHNSHGFKLLGSQIKDCLRGGPNCKKSLNQNMCSGTFKRLFMIFGVVADKDLDSIAEYLPNICINGMGEEVKAHYLFVNAKGTRALPAKVLQEKMRAMGFEGEVLANGGVEEALSIYMDGIKQDDDMVFIGGSTFVVAEAIPLF